MSLLSRIRRIVNGAPSAPPAVAEHDHGVEHASRHDRRAAGRERHHETGAPAWEDSDRIKEPDDSGPENPDRAPEILGG
jgi:hypothetical protein